MHISSQGFFLIRRPQFPLNLLIDFNQKVDNKPELFESELILFFSQPAVMEAIYIASPELYDSFVGMLEGKITTGADKLFKTLFKYLIRMSSRCTPYGLFAGCAVGEFSTETNIVFEEKDKFRTHTRLDMNYVAEMANDLLKRSEIRKQLKFFLNSSLYRVGDSYRFVEGYLKNKKRQYVLSAVESNKYLDLVIQRAKIGGTISELGSVLLIDDISLNEAIDYIESLISTQILVSELNPTVTGKEFFDILIEKVESMEHPEDMMVRQLQRINAILKQQNTGIQKYKEIESIIKGNFTTTSSKDLVQTDLFYNTRSCTISESAINILKNELSQIFLLGNPVNSGNLEQFKRRFLEKYEDQELPLLVAMDSETGIGYGSVTTGRADNMPLLDELFLPSETKKQSTDWTVLNNFRQSIYDQGINQQQSVIQLTDDMISTLKSDLSEQNPLPESFYLFGSLIARSPQNIDDGDFKFFSHAMGGPSGLKLLGRFCHGNPQLTDWVYKAVQEEEEARKDLVYAEIAHLPEARVGNVLMRPHFRKYEVVYLAGSSLPEEGQISADDLMVSIRNNEIKLRSRRLNKYICPRLTNAHNFATGLPVYRFLCDLANQSSYQYANWSWDYLGNKPFLPRIEYKHWILSKASWNLEAKFLDALLGKQADQLKEWSLLRTRFGIPRFCYLNQAGTDLLIDGDSLFSVQILCDTIRKSSKIKLTEFLEGPENAFLKDNGNCFTHEVLIPMINKVEPPASVINLDLNVVSVKRNFIVGSEWLYVKIYAGTKTADRLLSTVIRPFTEKLEEEGVIEKWFFIRFVDSDEHIRLRFFHSDRRDFWHLVLSGLNAILKPLVEDGTVLKVQVDTYKRELERYGRRSFEHIESVFYADSKAAIDCIDLLTGDEGERYRWLIALRGVDMLLNDLGITLESKSQYMNVLKQSFFKEFKGNTQLTVQLNDKYRAHRKEIESFLDAGNDKENNMQEVIEILKKRSASITNSLNFVLPSMEVSVESLARSLVHMFLNRLLVSKQRVHELVIYHYLSKYYESKLVRTSGSRKIGILVK